MTHELVQTYCSEADSDGPAKTVKDAVAAVTPGKAVYFDEIVKSNLRYLAGSIVHSMTWKYTKDEQARNMLSCLDTSMGASLPASCHLAPTQRLVRVLPQLFDFVVGLEKILQTQYLSPTIALHHVHNLFEWIEQSLNVHPEVRRLWTRVQCECQRILQSAGYDLSRRVSAETSVEVLQEFVRRYLLSKQRTWRIGNGVAPEHQNAMPIRVQLKQVRKQAADAVTKQLEKKLKLQPGTLDLVLHALEVVERNKGQALLEKARKYGAELATVEARQTKERLATSSGTASGATTAAVAAINGVYAVVLKSPEHGIEFAPVDGTELCVVQSSSRAKNDVHVLRSSTLRDGDFVIDVERHAPPSKDPSKLPSKEASKPSTTKEASTDQHEVGRFRSYAPRTLLETNRANFPLTVIVAPKDAVLVKGLSSVAGELLRALPKESKKRQRGAAATADATNDERGHAPTVTASSSGATPSKRHQSTSTPAKPSQRGTKKRSIGSDTPGTVPADTDHHPDDGDDAGTVDNVPVLEQARPQRKRLAVRFAADTAGVA